MQILPQHGFVQTSLVYIPVLIAVFRIHNQSLESDVQTVVQRWEESAVSEQSEYLYGLWNCLHDPDALNEFKSRCLANGTDFDALFCTLEERYGKIIPPKTAIEMYGDILSPNQTGHEVLVCHQVNCMGVMGAGLAKQLRDLFPQMYLFYKRVCDRTPDKQSLLGKIDCYPVNYNGYDYTIVSIFGQERYGRGSCFTDYQALRKAFQTIRCMATPLPARPLTRVRIPYRLGCGLAGGDWNIVKSIIQEELLDYDVIVEIWKKD